MRILNEDSDCSVKRVCLYLTRMEAESLFEQLGKLISKPKKHHFHVEDENFEREITVAIYSETNISEYDERSARLIEKDE